jgi:hypothetical protein
MRATRVLMVAIVVLAGCTVGGPYHAGTLVEPPARGESPLADDNWVAVVDLDDREVLGASRVMVGFNRDELTCEYGGDAAPDDVVIGSAVRFLRLGDGVDISSPPAIRGEDLRVECK